MAAGNGAGFALPASDPLRGGGRGAGLFRGVRRAGTFFFFFLRSLELKALPFGPQSVITRLWAALTRGMAHKIGADPETASRDVTDMDLQGMSRSPPHAQGMDCLKDQVNRGTE